MPRHRRLAAHATGGRGDAGRLAVVWSWLLFGLAVGAVTGLSQLAYFAAVASAGITIPTLIANGLGPILTALGQAVVFGERPDGRTLMALAGALTRAGAARA
jgi:drug/metabolite transporter (DMT)-like permease